jgi:hypothetical protein
MNGTGAKMIDDAAKRVDWGVMLEGDSFDLEDWESALQAFLRSPRSCVRFEQRL